MRYPIAHDSRAIDISGKPGNPPIKFSIYLSSIGMLKS